ncbi:unnamed protein product, partial [Oppiella nova]
MYLFSSPSSELLLESVEKDPSYHSSGKITLLWRRFLTANDHKTAQITWNRVVIPLTHIQHEYELMFSWSQTYRGSSGSTRNKQIIALDNISLSKECFGIGMPAPPHRPLPDTTASLHIDIPTNTSLTSYRLTPCGAVGRVGPTYRQCEHFYLNSNTRAAVIDTSSI